MLARPKEEEKNWFQPFVHVLNFDLRKHVSIGGRVLMTPSKSHAWSLLSSHQNTMSSFDPMQLPSLFGSGNEATFNLV